MIFRVLYLGMVDFKPIPLFASLAFVDSGRAANCKTLFFPGLAYLGPDHSHAFNICSPVYVSAVSTAHIAFPRARFSTAHHYLQLALLLSLQRAAPTRLNAIHQAATIVATYSTTYLPGRSWAPV